jgi:threonine/homoserine/homoserine lactone efflux protein
MEALVSFEIWAAFVLAAGIVLIIPGPTIILVISQSIAHGRKAVLPLSAGVVVGDFTAMTLSLLGLGAVLASSAALFSILKWIGAAYLIYLGVKLWCADPDTAEISLSQPSTPNSSHFNRAFIVTALNPKSIAFFVAFLPQFVRTQSHAFEQFVILGTTFLVLAGVNAMLYGFFAGRLRDAMLKAGVRRLFNRCGGSALVGAGLLTATMQRSS